MFGCTKETIRPQHFTQRAYSVRSNIYLIFLRRKSSVRGKKNLDKRRLISQLCLQELTVQAGDVGDRLVLRTNSLASTSVCTVTEAELIHACNHLLSTGSSFYTTLWEKCQLANL